MEKAFTKEENPEYPKEFIEHQVDFAQKAATLTGKPLAECLLYYTALYKILSGEMFVFGEPLEITWKLFTDSIKGNTKKEGISEDYYAIYQEQSHSIYKNKKRPSPFGCFKYDYNEKTKVISLHFTNHTRAKRGDLAKEYLPERISELARMFKDIRRKHPKAKWVTGNSWLYNLEAYCRLFPKEFTKNLRQSFPVEWMLRGTGLWGQFLTSEGFDRTDTSKLFRRNVKTAKTLHDLLNAFPYPILNPRCKIEKFFKKYENSGT